MSSRFESWLTKLWAALLLCCSSVQEGHCEEAWLYRSQAIKALASEAPLPGWLRRPITAQGTLETHRRQTSSAPSSPSKETPYSYVIFVSLSMGDQALKDIVQSHMNRKDTVIVFRGLPNDGGFRGLTSAIRTITKAQNPKALPAITIDPVAFTRANVTRVPAITYSVRTLIQLKVAGIREVEWMNSHIKALPSDTLKELVDLGTQGPTVEILEPDARDILKTRIREFNWADYQAKQIRAFWDHLHHDSLPDAIIKKQYTIDPAIEVPRTIPSSSGHTLIVKGQRLNPLSLLPINERILLFDARRESHLQWVEHIVNTSPHPSNLLITTSVDPDHGFEHLEALEKRLNTRVYLAPRRMVQRFKLKALPAMIQHVDHLLQLTESPPINLDGS